MDFKKADEMLKICETKGLSISEVMKQRECSQFETTEDEIIYKMKNAWNIMKESATTPTKTAVKSMGGLIGGEAKKLNEHRAKGKSIVGNVMSKAITYSMAVLEVNASMGLIVAAPTAGSSGVLPGVLLALQEEYKISDDRIIDAMFNASAIGYLAMQNATVSGAVGGCQAEIGVAAAMAASAATELMGGTPRECTYAASTVLMNMLGLICDPVLGLVEYPCQNRNASGAANALVAAEMSLAGITQMIPLDEMLDCMYAVGKRLPTDFRETAKGGCARTPSACALCNKHF
ncbi:MAG: L-serine ammonia-lyase, iron-sulfur-dependent, subunit alpha [Pseudobutyrivibrio sp.]|nr:L-serine ammonia-lyase, iron-sulfur-dependent, subunit alpha [Pseudobutyrivibrio sp.]